MTLKDNGDDARGGREVIPVSEPLSARRGTREVRGPLHGVRGRLRDAVHGPWQRERQRIRVEFGAQGLMPLLMKARNGAGWTRDERIQLWHHLRQIASLSPYLIVLLTPGSMVLLPVIAWWLDGRRVTRVSPSYTPPLGSRP